MLYQCVTQSNNASFLILNFEVGNNSLEKGCWSIVEACMSEN